MIHIARVENHCPRGTTQPKWAADVGRQLGDSKSLALLSLPQSLCADLVGRIVGRASTLHEEIEGERVV